MHAGSASLALIALLTALAPASDDTRPGPRAEVRAAHDDPMGGFARFVHGAWRLGDVHTTTWRWGPGRHSIAAHTVGNDVSGNPWRELSVYYRHPDLGAVRLLSLHPDIPGIGRGVGTGTVTFAGESATTEIELHQPGGRRRLTSRWTFGGPDTYHASLWEWAGDRRVFLAEWTYDRADDPDAPPAPGDRPAISDNLAPFEPLLGEWTTTADMGNGDAVQLDTSVRWFEHLDVCSARITPRGQGSDPAFTLDVYFYHHVGTDTLHYLALSGSGGVHEGVVVPLEGGALRLDPAGAEGEHSDPVSGRIEFQHDGSVHGRVPLSEGAERPHAIGLTLRRPDQAGEVSP